MITIITSTNVDSFTPRTLNSVNNQIIEQPKQIEKVLFATKAGQNIDRYCNVPTNNDTLPHQALIQYPQAI